MSPALRTEILQSDWGAGAQPSVSPELIDPAGFFSAANGLLDEDGGVYRRGGTAYKSNADFGSSGGRFLWDGYFAAGQRTLFANASDFGVLGADDETPVNLGSDGLSGPVETAFLGGMLFLGSGYIYAGSRKGAAYSTGTVALTAGSKTVVGTGTSWAANVDAGMLFQHGDERVYVVESVTDNTHLVLADAYEGSTAGGLSYSVAPIYKVRDADPYLDWEHIAVCANRLCLVHDDKVRFTEIDNPHTFTNSLGTTNEHTIPGGVKALGLASLNQILMVFTTAGVWRILGMAFDLVDAAGNSQHRKEELARDLVLFSATGIAGDGQTLVVPATHGVYLMDGVSGPVKISRPIERVYAHRVQAGYRAGQARVFRGHYLLPIISTGGSVRDNWVCRLDRPQRVRGQTIYPWTRLDGDGGEIPAYAVRHVSSAAPDPVLLGIQSAASGRVVDCNAYFEPEIAFKADADGSAHILDLITRDFETGDLTENRVRALRLFYEMAVDSGDDSVIELFYGDGAMDAGAAKWNRVTWNNFKWAGEVGAKFVALGCDAGPSRGVDPHRCRVNKRLRRVRFRIRTRGPVASCVIRGLEVLVAPSQAGRR